MGSDFERWKRRRDAERAARDRDSTPPHGRPTPPPLQPTDAPPVATSPASRRTQPPSSPPPTDVTPPDDGPPRPPRRAARPPRRRGRGRGCLNCLGCALLPLLVVLLGLLLAGGLYWRQIEARGQVNVLILGIDERAGEAPPYRSDTMILSGFDPRARRVALLAIPRDLWVDVPGEGSNRINTAHFYGGPPLAKRAVANALGAPVHYYVRLNFDGFVSLIDAMGGITVDVPERLYDTNYPTPDYGVTTIEIPAGVQEMDGATALIYVRSRYSTSDFDRSRRQQEIIGAVQQRLRQPATWRRAPAILVALRGAVQSDMPLSEYPALTFVLLRSDLERAALGPEQVRPFTTDGGAQVLLPVDEQVAILVGRYFR